MVTIFRKGLASIKMKSLAQPFQAPELRANNFTDTSVCLPFKQFRASPTSSTSGKSNLRSENVAIFDLRFRALGSEAYLNFKSQERKRHININLFLSGDPSGDRAVSRPGSNVYVLSSEPKEHNFLLSGRPAGRTGDRGDRKDFYMLKFDVPFLVPIKECWSFSLADEASHLPQHRRQLLMSSFTWPRREASSVSP